jgi:tetratricopeptide (TPR) repeat protein
MASKSVASSLFHFIMDKFKTILLLFFILFFWPVFSQDKIDLLILNKKYDKALTEIEKQYNELPSAGLMFKKGLVYKLQQQYQKAAEAFFAASEITPQDADILGELAEALSSLDNYADAASFFKQALTVDPENLVLAGKLGFTYINLKDYKSGTQIFSSLYQKDSTNVFWNKQYAFCLGKTRTGDSLAIRLYEKILVQNPRDLSIYSSLYFLYSRQKDEKKALDVLNRGLVEFPDDNELTLKLANFYFVKKNYIEAAGLFKKYLSMAGTEYDVLKNYGICLYLNKSEKEAIEIFDKCMEITFNDPVVLFYLSLSHKRLADYELAEDFIKAAIEAATPSYLPEMYHNLGQIYGQERKFQESIDALQESYDQDTTNFEILFEIATTYEELSFNRTVALNYYRNYLIQAGESAQNVDYALNRIKRIKEEMFFKE